MDDDRPYQLAYNVREETVGVREPLENAARASRSRECRRPGRTAGHPYIGPRPDAPLARAVVFHLLAPDLTRNRYRRRDWPQGRLAASAWVRVDDHAVRSNRW